MGQFVKAKIANRVFALALFIGCGTFVAFRGYKCFEKFWSHPQNVEYAYVPGNDPKVPFPTLTFCKSSQNLNVSEFKDMIKEIRSKSHHQENTKFKDMNNQPYITFFKPSGISLRRRGNCVGMSATAKFWEKGPRDIKIYWKYSIEDLLYFNAHHPLVSWPRLPVI